MHDNTNNLKSLLGNEISKRRIFAKLKQRELATLLEMTPPQLNKLEKGVNLPTAATLSRIEDCLHLTPGCLIAIRSQILDNVDRLAADRPERPLERLKAACEGPHSIPEDKLERLATDLIPRIDRYIELEDALELPHLCQLGLNEYPTSKPRHGLVLAEALRERLAVGNAPLHDLLPVLEQHGIRILFVDDLPPILPSGKLRTAFSFHDTRYDTPVICLNRKSSVASQLYNLAYEIGTYLRYRHLLAQGHPKRPRYDESDFCRPFASTLLIPTTALLDLLDRLRINSDQWTTALLDTVARRFGASSRAMVWRLESLARIDSDLSEELKRNLVRPEWMKAHPEFTPRPPLPENTWLTLLTERAKIG